MKKFIGVILAVIMAFSVTACGKSEAAKAADEKIASIGEVTLKSNNSIISAENAVKSLSDRDKEHLENLEILTEARKTYNNLLNQKKADEIEVLISAIGVVSLDNTEPIDKALDAYNLVPNVVKDLVENKDELVTAQETLSNLRVSKTEELINSIGTVNRNSKPKIDAAREMYNSLSGTEKSKVTNYDILKSSKKQYGEQLIANLNVREDKVRNLKFYYPKVIKLGSTGYYADVRSFVLPSIVQKNDNYNLNIICNYTADDWVFFEKIIFAIDDERITWDFDHYEITREVGYGDIYETENFRASAEDIKTLWKIANSNETIIRFEGREHYDDITVNNADKQAIEEVLTAYEILIKG